MVAVQLGAQNVAFTEIRSNIENADNGYPGKFSHLTSSADGDFELKRSSMVLAGTEASKPTVS
jgi:hypothetical protein